MYFFNRTINCVNIFLVIVLAFFVFNILLVPAQGAAINDTIKGLNQSASKAYLGRNGSNVLSSDSGVITDIPSLIGKVVGAGLAFIGVIFFILIIYGGFSWMTARGNEQEVIKAKELFYAAVIGLIIVLSAYAITSYLGGVLFGK
jgi:hypothetical protein